MFGLRSRSVRITADLQLLRSSSSTYNKYLTEVGAHSFHAHFQIFKYDNLLTNGTDVLHNEHSFSNMYLNITQMFMADAGNIQLNAPLFHMQGLF